tara:strand:- start:400 stop:1335 length:936 start_codon:yes stop_codon:yes gene_type:complete
MNPVNQILIEGPDLSGKTSLYSHIHKLTDYRWNIQDRSALSMLVHAKFYNRDTFNHVENLNSELNNLNNFMMILLPDWSVISKRFADRGDEIQSLTSLRKIYLIFQEAAKELELLPNVCVIRQEVDDYIAKSLVADLIKFETRNFYNLSKLFLQAAHASKEKEKIGLSLTSYDSGTFSGINTDYLNYEKEKVYYSQIRETLIKKIDDELHGINEYFREEDVSSRRFIYTSDTCISLAHFMIRKQMLDCKFFLRSSNVKDTLTYDLNFIKYLCKEVYNFLKLENHTVKISVTINSAHILSNMNVESENKIED